MADQPTIESSVFAAFAWKFLERDISVVPIAPGSKKPGQYSQEQGWRGMGVLRTSRPPYARRKASGGLFELAKRKWYGRLPPQGRTE